MKLIYSKGACSLAVHILFEEMGIAYESESVSLHHKTLLDSVSSKGHVPLLELEHGEVLCECVSILQYLAEKDHRLELLGGAPGSLEKFRCLEWLNFFSTEIHKAVQPLFRKDLSDSFKADIIKTTGRRLQFINDHLIGKIFLSGDRMTIADMYAIVNLHILQGLKFNMNRYPEIHRYMTMMDEVPSVKRATMLERDNGRPGNQQTVASVSENDLASMGLS